MNKLISSGSDITKRIIVMLACGLLCASLVACKNNGEVSGSAQESSADGLTGLPPCEFETDEQLRAAFPQKYDLSYEELLNTDRFAQVFNAKFGSYEDAYAAVPFKVAGISKEEKEILSFNIWYVPVVHDDKCCGMVCIDFREGEPGPREYRMEKEFFHGFDKASANGDMVLFTLGDAFYGMYRDNTAFILSDQLGTIYEVDFTYEGNFTFDDLNQGYNFVPQNWKDTVVYKPETQ